MFLAPAALRVFRAFVHCKVFSNMLHSRTPDGRALAVPWYGPVAPLAAMSEDLASLENSQRSESTQPTIMDISSRSRSDDSCVFVEAVHSRAGRTGAVSNTTTSS